MRLNRSTWLKNSRFTPPTPPTPPVLADLTLTQLAFPENVPEGAPIASIGGKTTGSTLALAQASAWFSLSGTQLLKGAVATPDADYEISIEETLTGAVGSPKDNPFTLTATAVSPVGAVNFGAKTRAGHGGVPSNNSPGSTITGAGAADWRIDAEGDLVPSGTYGSVKTFSRSSYVLTLANASVATVTMVTSQAHVKWKNNASLVNVDTSGAFQLRTLLAQASGTAGAMVYGDKIVVRPGVQNNVSSSTLGGLAMRIRAPLGGYAGTPGGWITVEAEFPVDLNSQSPGVCQMTNLGADTALMTSGTRDFGLSFEGFQCMRPGTQTSGCFTAAATNGKVSRLRFRRNRFWGGVINSAFGLDISSGVYMPATAENVIFEENVCHDLYNPIQIGGANPVVRNNVYVRAYNDFIKLSAPVNALIDNNIQIDKRIPVGLPENPHGDYYQEAHAGQPSGDVVGSTITRQFTVTGQTAPIYNQDGGMTFIDDAPVTTKLVGVTISQGFGLNRQKNVAVSISNPADSLIENYTAIYEPDSTTGANIGMRGSANGLINRCYSSSVAFAEYKPGAGGGTVPSTESVVTNSVAFNPTFGFTWAAVAAKHAAAFLSPSYGADNGYPATEVPTWDAVMTLVAQIKRNWSPKMGVAVADGGLMSPDGRYIGAFFPKNADGSVDWNDGSVYVPH